MESQLKVKTLEVKDAQKINKTVLVFIRFTVQNHIVEFLAKRRRLHP